MLTMNTWSTITTGVRWYIDFVNSLGALYKRLGLPKKK